MRNRCTIITRVRTSEGIVGEAYNADEDEPLQSEIRAILHDEPGATSALAIARVIADELRVR